MAALGKQYCTPSEKKKECSMNYPRSARQSMAKPDTRPEPHSLPSVAAAGATLRQGMKPDP